jgi:flagellar export protein FliJ
MNLAMLRTYRTQVEEALQMELAELQNLLQAEQAARGRLEEAAEAGAAEYLDSIRHGMTVDDAMTRQTKLDALVYALRRAEAAATEAERRCEQKMMELLDAARERKKVEILEERQAQVQRRMTKRREQAVMDEAAGRRHLTGTQRAGT